MSWPQFTRCSLPTEGEERHHDSERPQWDHGPRKLDRFNAWGCSQVIRAGLLDIASPKHPPLGVVIQGESRAHMYSINLN